MLQRPLKVIESKCGKRHWKGARCVVLIAVVLLLPWTSSPYKGNRWNLSSTSVLTFCSKKENCLERWLKPVSPRQLVERICSATGHFHRSTVHLPHFVATSAVVWRAPGQRLCHVPAWSPWARYSLGSALSVRQLHRVWPRLGVQRWEKAGPLPALKQPGTVSSGTIEPLVFILSLSG